jgi:hypothetical protein
MIEHIEALHDNGVSWTHVVLVEEMQMKEDFSGVGFAVELEV